MKKLLCAVICTVLVGVLGIDCCAQSADISLYAEKSGRTSVCVNVFAKSDTLVSGGVFAIAFDDSVVSFKDASSELFEVDARLYDSKIEVVIASEKGVDLSDSTEVFSVKFSRICEDDFDISVQVKSLVDNTLTSFTPDVCTVDYVVDVTCDVTEKTKSATDKDTNIKSETSKTSRKTESEKSESQSSFDVKDKDEVSAYSDVEPTALKVDKPKRNTVLLIAIVCLMVVSAFVFGVVCRKSFFEKKDKQ